MKIGDIVSIRETASSELLERFSINGDRMKWVVVDMITDIAGYSCDPVVTVVGKNSPDRLHFFVKDMEVYRLS